MPPWWPAELARAAGAQERTALTSRNALLPLRRALAERHPDVMKSGGGGSNAILARSRIAEHRRLRLRWWPERRVAHGVRLLDGTWAVNLHATVHDPPRALGDIERARRAALEWAGQAPVLVGGDLNVRHPAMEGFHHAGGHGVDHLFARGLEVAAPVEVLHRGALSDHAPVAVVLRGPAGKLPRPNGVLGS